MTRGTRLACAAAVSALPSSSRRRDPDGTPPQASGASFAGRQRTRGWTGRGARAAERRRVSRRGEPGWAAGWAAGGPPAGGRGGGGGGGGGGAGGPRSGAAPPLGRAALRGVGGGIDTPPRVVVGLVGRRRLRRLVGGLGR